jgi:hypothetical protein
MLLPIYYPIYVLQHKYNKNNSVCQHINSIIINNEDLRVAGGKLRWQDAVGEVGRRFSSLFKRG